jgi:tetrahydromethanopterin S-methyltransferase subunit F
VYFNWFPLWVYLLGICALFYTNLLAQAEIARITQLRVSQYVEGIRMPFKLTRRERALSITHSLIFSGLMIGVIFLVRGHIIDQRRSQLNLGSTNSGLKSRARIGR